MAHPDLNQLLNTLLPLAEQLLAKHGEFFPFGATMTSSGNINQNSAYTGEEHPKSQELIKLMTQAFQQQTGSGQLRAAGICMDIRVIPPGQTEKTDAICLGLEHVSGESVNVCVPYKKGWFGKIKYGTLFAGQRKAEFFIKSEKPG
jgi:hypothetical protein